MRMFVRRMMDVAHSKKSLYHWVYLNKDFKSDLLWWHLFPDRWHGISCIASHIIEAPPDFVMFSDASGAWGCGAICGTQWLQCQWNKVFRTVALQADRVICPVTALVNYLSIRGPWRGLYL